jgi:hypothetical protein
MPMLATERNVAARDIRVMRQAVLSRPKRASANEFANETSSDGGDDNRVYSTPSGLNAHWSLSGIAEAFRQVRTAADGEDQDLYSERPVVPDPGPADAHPG